MTDQIQVLFELTEMFRGIFEDPGLTLTRDSSAKSIAAWDSARMVEIIIETESLFGVRFSTRDVDGLQCVGDLVDLILRKKPA